MQYCACKLHGALPISQLPPLVKSLKDTISASATQSSSTALSAEVSLTRKFWTEVPRHGYEQQLHLKLAAWQRKLSLLDSSVSLTLKRWRTPNDFKVYLALISYVSVSSIICFCFSCFFLKNHSNWLLSNCAPQKPSMLSAIILKWTMVPLTTSRDSMSKVGDKHQADTLVPWGD